jgi:hypothetical protein
MAEKYGEATSRDVSKKALEIFERLLNFVAAFIQGDDKDSIPALTSPSVPSANTYTP